MRAHVLGIVLSLLFGGGGALLAVTGLSDIRSLTAGSAGASQMIGGLMLFFIGAWLFFRSTLRPSVENLPVYAWTEYFLIFLLMASFGLILIMDGIESIEAMTVLIGFLMLFGAFLYALAKFPALRTKP